MANVNKDTRSAARSSATGAAQTGSSARKPAPRDESGSTDAAAQPETAVRQPVPIVVIAPNPKRKGTIAFDHYAKYGKPGVMTTDVACREAGVRGKDLSWDRDRQHILAGEAATNFPCGKSTEVQAQYLQSLGIEDAKLIKWGYLPEPVKEEAAATEATAS